MQHHLAEVERKAAADAAETVNSNAQKNGALHLAEPDYIDLVLYSDYNYFNPRG